MANELAELKLHVRTADQTRRAELALDGRSTGAEIIQAAVDNWKLPADTDYTLVNTTTGKALVPTASLAESGVKPGDVLEVQPVLVAGASATHGAAASLGASFRWQAVDKGPRRR